MVARVNEEDVPVEEILSDSVYLYFRKEDNIRIA